MKIIKNIVMVISIIIIILLVYYCNVVPSATSNELKFDIYILSVMYTPGRCPHYVYLIVR